MSRSTRRRTWLGLLAGMLVCLLGGAASAQDRRDEASLAPPPAPRPLAATTTPDGFTVWRSDINSGCYYSDHLYTLDIPAEPADMSEITYSMSNYDVDYNSSGCAGGPEVDLMYFNGNSLGFLTGADSSWSINSWPLTPSQVVKGSNAIRIDTDATNTGCWCVGVGYIEVRAKVGFKVKSHTPQNDDKNRDFHAGNVDLTVTFSSEFDAGTLSNSTFLLEYRDAVGSWQPVSGGFTQLAPEKFSFAPSADLKDGIRYRATVKGGASGVLGKNGGQLPADEVWYFHTVPDLSLTDAFDYGDGNGSRCPPTVSPCPGVELAVFQVARNASMVPGGKEAVARLYLRWKQHTDVHPDDQVKELEVDASIDAGGTRLSQVQTVKRPDRYTSAEREVAAHTLNLKHTPGSSFSYSAEVTPRPQTNASPVKYTQSLNLASTGRSPRIHFDYYTLKDGAWSGGIPAADKTDGINTMTAGSQFVTDQFPVLGTSFTQKGDLRIGYTFTGNTVNAGNCGTVKEVACPGSGGRKTPVAEYVCVYNALRTLRGADKFAAATVPNTLCNGATAFALGGDVFMHQAGTGANDGTVAHEVGHLYGISTANSPTSGHQNDSTKVEGFHVRTNINRSYVENPTKAISLMHTTLQPPGTQWIENSDYATLLGSVTLAADMPAWRSFALAAGPYLIVSGLLDMEAGDARLEPAFLQEAPNELPSTSGTCTAELLDGAGAMLASDFFTPGISVSIQHLDGSVTHSDATLTTGYQPFSVSLPWSDAAQQLRLSCNGNVLLVQQRSAHAPVVDFIGLFDGAALSGTQQLSWFGSDADSADLSYQLQLSDDGGASWKPLTPLMPDINYSLDTTLLSSGPWLLRVLVTDGFNTAYATRSVAVFNPLRVQGVMPASGAVEVGYTSTIQASFVTPVDVATLTPSTFQLLEGGSRSVTGSVSYDAISRMARFTPTTALKPLTVYVARLLSSVRDIQGNALGVTYQWSFTTAPDRTPPVVTRVSPVSGALDVPLDALVQVEFNEAMNAQSVTSTRFQLLDVNGLPVPGTVFVSSSRPAAVFIPSVALAPGARYTARVSADVTDAAGNRLGEDSTWSFTTGNTASGWGYRIIGNYSDHAFDTNGDGLFDNLTLSVDVEVRTGGYYNLNARLLDAAGTLLGWQSTGNVYLEPGVHTLKLVYGSVPIRSNGADGPYTLDSVSFYWTSTPSQMDVRYKAYQTFPYSVKSFYSALGLSKLPDQLLEWNTTRDNAFNLRDYTTPQPVQSVRYSILINTDPRVGVSIDSGGYIDINPVASIEAQSDVVIRAMDSLGNSVTSTFRVSVQKPRPSKLMVPEALTLKANQSQPIDVQVTDQWGRPLTSQVTVTFETTQGTVSPSSVTTSTSEASTVLTAGPTAGTGFVTTRVGEISALTRVQVIDPPRPSQLIVPEELTVIANESLPMDVRVLDQWGQPLTSQVTVTFDTMLCWVSPASVITSTGEASTVLTAAPVVGTGFVITRVGELSAMTRVQVLAPPPPREVYPIAFHMYFLHAAQPGQVLRNVPQGSQSGHFGWLSWTGDLSEDALVRSLTPPGDSKRYVNPYDAKDDALSVGDWVSSRPGVVNSAGMRNALEALKPLRITVPVFEEVSGNGSGTKYRVAAFACVQITDYQLSGQGWVSATFYGSGACR